MFLAAGGDGNFRFSFSLTLTQTATSETVGCEVHCPTGFMSSPEHCRVSEYILEYPFCGVPGCKICTYIGREVRTLDIDVGDYNLREEVLRWVEYPIIDSGDPEH